MKKVISFTIAVTGMFLMSAIIINPLTRKTTLKYYEGGNPIPDEIMKIAKKSCLSCHGENGNFMAQSKVDFSKWDKYSPEKQASKAEAMCNMVTKEKMPPKKFKENNPEGVPSKEEIKTICDWAQSLQLPKK